MMTELYECDHCGLVVDRQLYERAWKRTLAGVDHVAWGDCEPEERASECPGCGAVDSFHRPAVCAECWCRPCECEADSAAELVGEALVLLGQGDYERAVYPRDIQGCWLARAWAWVRRKVTT